MQYTNFIDVAHTTTEEYFRNGGEFSINTFIDKYPADELEKKFPAKLFWRVAKTAAQYEATPELREYWAQRWFHEMWVGMWRPGGSIMAALGVPGKQSTANCTTIEIKDDNLESIFEAAYKMAKAAAYRQGLGIDISPLRPRGARITNSAKISTGPVHWADFLNTIGRYVGQSGRIPAFLLSLKDHHPDIFEFLTAKSNLNKIENANISVQVSDALMIAYENDVLWELYYFVKDNNEDIRRSVKARDLVRTMANEACAFAEPGVQFIDNVRRESMTDPVGYKVMSTNALVRMGVVKFCELLER